MAQFWKKLSEKDIRKKVFSALENNVDYDKENVLGIPASFLDDKVFNQDTSFLKEAPYMSTLIQNPNHIGCHTLGNSEPYYKGTQEIEMDLLDICAVDILKGEQGKYDGYVASGGTEANLQAIWTYRNYFKNVHAAKNEEIAILCSVDSHYSVDKASNLLTLDIYKINVDEYDRGLMDIDVTINKAKSEGKSYFIVLANMMTTMFGSVDNITYLTDELFRLNCTFKLHIDAAFGGFYYPFTNNNSELNFQNPHISSFTLDAHKMAQAPYGIGIFLIRKGYMENIHTKEASYIQGDDFTLIGSRSGANAISAWMILSKNGPFSWQEKIFIMQKRAEWMCNQLSQLNIKFYRYPYSNIIAIKSSYVSSDVANLFGLVPDNHKNPKWQKIVIMEHVTIEKLTLLVDELEKSMAVVEVSYIIVPSTIVNFLSAIFASSLL
jgi:glutamate/tyrosine decarboxylase-like PLP-dependent enzyme